MTNTPLFIEQSQDRLGTMDSCGSYPFEALEYDIRSGFKHVIERAELERLLKGKAKRRLRATLVLTSPEGQQALVLFKVVRLTVDPNEHYWDSGTGELHKDYCRSRCVVTVLAVTTTL